LCKDCQYISTDIKALATRHINNALSTLKIKEPLGISERKNKKIKEKKLIEKLIEILLNNGGIAFNGDEIVHYVEGGKVLAISKGIMESNNELRRGVVDGVAGGNIDFYDTHDENNESINKSPSEFEILINKPPLKKVTEYKGKSVAVLVDKNLRIKYIEMVSKLQVEKDIKRIVFHDEMSKILENSHENSETDKKKLNKLNLPQNIKEEIFDACIMNEDETYCTVKRSEKIKLIEALMFIKTVLSSLDYYDLKDDEIKKQIKHQICSRKLYEAYLDEISFSARSRNTRLPFSEDEFRFLTF
jgi:hypothetical protein